MVDPGIALCLGVRAEVYLPGYLIFLALVSYSKTILKRKKKTSLLFPLKIARTNTLNEKKLKNMNVVGNYKHHDGHIVQ